MNEDRSSSLSVRNFWWHGNARLLILVVCVLVVAGCGKGRPVAPVRGTVTLDGKPLPGGRIMFEPIASGPNKIVGKAAFGQIQSDGSFVLSTYEEGDGAVVGSHHPVIFGNRVEDPRVENPKRPTIPGPNIGLVRLQDKTLDVVAEKENVFSIEVKSRDLRLDGVTDD
jgi:hypothetical protein